MVFRIARLRMSPNSVIPASILRRVLRPVSRSKCTSSAMSKTPSKSAFSTNMVAYRASIIDTRTTRLRLQRRTFTNTHFQRDDSPTVAQTQESDPRAPPDHLTEGESEIWKRLQALEPASLMVQDVSGGCGTMYAIEIASPKFKGRSMILQHRLVNEQLKGLVETWHGVQLRTQVA